jgi:signal transduction histidine kinase
MPILQRMEGAPGRLRLNPVPEDATSARMASLRASVGEMSRTGGKRAAAALAGLAQARGLIGPLVFTLAYVALEWISYSHEHLGVPVTPWNPGVGIAFGLIVLKGAAYGLALFAGVVMAEVLVLQTELAWPAVGVIAVVVAATYTVAAGFARRRLHLYAIGDVRDVLVLLSAGTTGAAIVALLLSALLLIDQEVGNDDLTKSVLPLFVGDMIGIAVMTPLLLRLSSLWRQRSLWLEWWRSPPLAILTEVALFALVTGFALWMIVGSARPNDYKYFSLLFLPVVVVAVRHGFDGACLALASTQLGLVALLRAYGYDAATFTEFQIVMLVLTMTGLLVGGVVSERERADQTARQAEARMREAELEAARAARFNMVSGMASALAHEISQPMTAARALARSAQQLVDSRSGDIDRVKGNLASLVAQIDHAADVIRRMRDFLRRGQPHVSTLDMAGVLEDALILARPEAAARGARIDLEIDPSLPAVFGDRIQLQQVVLNLVRNGIDAVAEAGARPGCIAVRAFPSDDRSTVEVSVADNGTGIASDRDLFAPLSSSKKDGLGLGLSICANIVHAHGGRIWLQSGARGATEFRFSLPLQPET